MRLTAFLTCVVLSSLQTAETFAGPVNGAVSWSYDHNFRVTSERVRAANEITFAYDADSLLTRTGTLTYTRRASDGLLLTAAIGATPTTTTFTYSGFGELATEETRRGATVFYRGVYTRDDGGRLAEKTETIGGVATVEAYSYDLAGRLTGVSRGGAPVAGYTYDLNGNRTSVTTPAATVAATYDEQDRILTFGARTYAHAAHGEVASWTESGATTTLSYDVQGNLLAVGLPTGTLVQYEVDGRNRRLRRLVNGVATHGFLYQGQLRPVAELDGAGNLVSRFVYGARAVAPEYLIRGGVSYRLVADHLGSVRLVVNTTSGAIIQRLDYDAYGKVTLDTNPGFQPFGYAGGLYDPLTGLVRFGARDYDPLLGRWLTKDPIGFKAGDSNLYTYVGSNPVNAVDPTGLVIWDVIDLVFFGQDVMAFLNCPGGAAAFAVAVGAIGALPGIPSLGWLRTADSVVEEGISVYRIWGDRAGPWGQSWTTVNPSSITNFRSAAGLPDANTGRFVSEGILTTTKDVTLRPSLIIKPAQQGGLPELVIKNAEQAVRLLRVSGVNPKY